MTNEQQCNPEDSKKSIGYLRKRKDGSREEMQEEKIQRTRKKDLKAVKKEGPGVGPERIEGEGDFSPLGSKGPHQVEEGKFLPELVRELAKQGQ